jgi:PPE-repeat protein
MSLLISVADYEDAAIRYHRKFLQIQAFLEKNGKNRKPTRQQWQQRFVKDPNAMDLTPGRTRARAAHTDDEMSRLRQEGKCFKCKHQGHIGHNCPNQNSQVHATNTSTASSGAPQTHPIPATNTSTASSGTSAPSASIRKAITAQELVDLVQDMDQGEKDKVIQDIFMQEDFATALT